MPSTSVYIYFEPSSLATAGFEGRDELEYPVDEALQEYGLGEVTGGGSGVNGTNIDIEVTDEARLGEAITLIRRILSDLNAPMTTLIQDQYGTVYQIED